MTPEERAAEAFDAGDPALNPDEKETVLQFGKRDNRVRFYTAERGIGSRLLHHGAAEIEGVTVVGDGRARPEKRLEEVDQDDHVVGVRGTLPVGALSILSRPRDTNQHAAVVSDRVLKEAQP